MRMTSEEFLISVSYVEVTVPRKNFMRVERCAVLLGNTLFVIAVSSIYTLTFSPVLKINKCQ